VLNSGDPGTGDRPPNHRRAAFATAAGGQGGARRRRGAALSDASLGATTPSVRDPVERSAQRCELGSYGRQRVASMINTPAGVAQFCDVPPGRDAPAPELSGRAALSCSFLGRDLDVCAVGPAQVRSSDGWQESPSLGSAWRSREAGSQRATGDQGTLMLFTATMNSVTVPAKATPPRKIRCSSPRRPFGSESLPRGPRSRRPGRRRAAEHGHQPGHRPGMRVGGVELGILSHLGEEHMRGG
jgi:hypothetical protein